jgi:hypothetical protein
MRAAKAVAAATFAGVALLALWIATRPKPKVDPEPGPPAGHRIPHLQRLVEQQRLDSSRAADGYAPEAPAGIDDLAAAPTPLLRGLPGVVAVEALVVAERPTHRIIHLRDWHLVPKDLYAADLRSATGRPLSDADIDALHAELLLEVELVQLEQAALLRCLARRHGLRRVLIEGLTPDGVEALTARVDAVRGMLAPARAAPSARRSARADRAAGGGGQARRRPPRQGLRRRAGDRRLAGPARA